MNALHAELEAVVGPGALLTDPADLIAYGFDGTFFDNTPALVVLPRTAEEVAAIHRVASRRKLPLTPRAMGSGLSGGSVPLAGSIVLGVARMDRVIAIDRVDRVAVVQPGVITAERDRRQRR
jgi:glycolate oxidase